MPASERIRVAILAAGEIFGGAERQILTLLGNLDQRTISPILVLFHDRELAERCRALGIPVFVLGVRGTLDLRAIRRLRSILKDERIHVLHFHGYRAAVHSALAAWNSRELFVVKTEHGAVELRSGSFVRNLRPRIYRWLENMASKRMSTHVVYVTGELRHRCAPEHRDLPTQVIYNGVDMPEPSSFTRPLDFAAGYHHLLIIGRLEPVKGVETAIRAMSHLDTARRCLLHILGDGPERANLVSLAESIGVLDKVRFHGFCRDVQPFLAFADCILMPSLHEGLPYTVLEAMAMRVPVVASKVGGLAEVLKHRETAMLIQPRSPEVLARTIEELLSDAGLSKQLGKAAYELMTERFTANAMTDAYAALYGRVSTAS